MMIAEDDLLANIHSTFSQTGEESLRTRDPAERDYRTIQFGNNDITLDSPDLELPSR